MKPRDHNRADRIIAIALALAALTAARAGNWPLALAYVALALDALERYGWRTIGRHVQIRRGASIERAIDELYVARMETS